MDELKRPLITSANPAWLSAIAIKGSREPFTVIGPASSVAHLGQRMVSFENVKLENPLSTYVSRDPYSIPMTDDREGYYGDAHFDWWLSGLYDYLAVRQAIARFGGGLKQGDRVFE